MAHKDTADTDIDARRAGSPASRSRKVSHSTPMMQQRPDRGGASAQQTLVRLVGSHDAGTKKAGAVGPQQAAQRSRPRH
jgi:hypothetical protein